MVQFFRSITPVHSPWIAVTAFYKAIHIVEAVFASDKAVGHTSNHDDRERRLKANRKYDHIFKNFSQLKRASVNARYLAGCKTFDDYLSPQDVVDKLLKHNLHQVEESAVKKLLKNSGALQRILEVFS